MVRSRSLAACPVLSSFLALRVQAERSRTPRTMLPTSSEERAADSPASRTLWTVPRSKKPR
eukprot:1935827-Alexandrium_andersonii.AAC.1